MRRNIHLGAMLTAAPLLSPAVVPFQALAATPDRPFGNAKWIGAPADMQPFHPNTLTVFKISFDLSISGNGEATFFYGADDPRLMDADMNIYNLAAKPGESRMEVRFIAADNGAEMQVYRIGYHPADKADVPLESFPLDNFKTDGSPNKVEILTNFGHTEFIVNGKSVGRKGVNPVGNGGDYIAFPAVATIGVKMSDKGNARISDIEVSNFRAPGNVIARAEGSFTSTQTVPLQEKAMPELKTSINLHEQPSKADVKVSARGIYDIYVNGRLAGEDYFKPGWTQYNKTHTWREIDIAPYLKKGNNDIRIELGEGWWSGPSTFVGENWNFYGDRQSVIADIAVEYPDGSVESFPTSPSTWSVSTDGRRKLGSFFQGEIFDATLTPDRQTWTAAVEIPLEGTTADVEGGWGNIEFIPAGRDRIMPVDTLTAIAMTEPREGVYVYDMGQNFAGIPYLSFAGLKPGTEVSMRYGEVLYPDMPQYAANKGMVMTENLRAAMNHDVYTARGGKEIFSPRMTLHGYRYIELTGIDSPLPLASVKALPLSSVPGIKAHYECSDTLVNRLWKNIEWSTLSNFISIPTDCAQRNERLGWMGDISVFGPSATKIADVEDLLSLYLQSVRDCTHPDGRFPDVAPTGFGFGSLLWGSAGITVPWEHFSQYADLDVIREHYLAMKRYIQYILDNTFDPATGVLVQNHAWGDLGDWLSPVYDRDDKSLLWECYFIYDLSLMKTFAELLGNSADADYYSRLIDSRKDFFKKTYVDPKTGKTVHSAFNPDRIGRPVDTQASYAVPIALGVYTSPEFEAKFVNTLTRSDKSDGGIECPPYSLMTGFIGTAWISKALSKINRDDLAYRLLASTNYPSWLYPVTQGATTIWERLDSYTHKAGFGSNNSMNSFNHYSFGSVADWLLTRSLGINFNRGMEPGKVVISPTPDPTGKITFAKGYIDYPEGRIESSWKVDGDKVVYEISVPKGVKAYFNDLGKLKKLKAGKNRIRKAIK